MTDSQTQLYNLSAINGLNELINNQNLNKSNILKLNKIECKINNAQYKVIRYDKNILSDDSISTYGLCRSLILNSDNQIICFSPPKSYKPDHFISLYNANDKFIQAEEFVEGTMINVFFNKSVGITGTWEISTRNTVGATSVFYKSKLLNTYTFRDMFIDACKNVNLDINKLDKNLSYSFVLQHPMNRIVVPFSNPCLYLVGVYKINNEIDNITVNFFDVSDFVPIFKELGFNVKFPEIYKFSSYSELIDKYASMNTPYQILGVVIYNKKTGERTKIRNPVYEQVRQLRGNHPKLQYQYLCLRKEGNVKNYLKYYPEHKNDFLVFRDQVHLFTDTLFKNYIGCYIKKEKKLINYSEQFRTHMFKLHEIYITKLREKKLFITNTIVKKYVNELQPALLMYCINYNMRQNYIDTIKVKQ